VPATAFSPIDAPAGQTPAGVRPDLLERFASVPDPRSARGRRHTLASILALAACATAAGCKGPLEIQEWARDAPSAVLAALGCRFDPFHGHQVPHATTIDRALEHIDGDVLDAALGAHLTDLTSPDTDTDTDTDQPVVAIDGKTLRGARRPDGTAPHLVAAYDQASGAILGQRQVAAKTNEIPEARTLLGAVEVTGRLITLDALHTCEQTARSIVEDAKADYLLTVKANRPALLHAAALVLSGPDSDFATFTDTTRGHGRVEQRTVRVCPAPEDIDFPHAAQVVRIIRRRKPRGAPTWESKETVYAVTSRKNAGPAAIATAIRGHWEIENKLHWVRDTAYREDESRVRTGNAPRVLASLRNLAISLLRISGTGRIVAALRHNARDHHRPLALLGITT